MRVVCSFSCGAASAVAAKLAIAEYGHKDVRVVNAFIAEEHPDNRRFLVDCEKWLEHQIDVVRDERFKASTLTVWQKERFIKSRHGAPCSRALKRIPLEKYSLPGDINVIGYTSEEQDRLDGIRDRHKHMTIIAPLIDFNLSKSDCLAMIERAGIQLPEMYRLGFHNANCIGCPKGGEGYWNKVRDVFPERFIQIQNIQENIGEGAYFFYDKKSRIRYGLKDLQPGKGNYPEERAISCSFFCDIAEQDIEATHA